MTSMVSPPRSTRLEAAFPELLPDALQARGHEADVFVCSRWFARLPDLRPEYEQVVRDRYPDVVVLNYGVIDCQPNMLPTSVARHFQTWNRRGSLGARAYRRLVAARLWPLLRQYQLLTDGLPTYRTSPKAFRAELTRLIALIRLETRALVLVLDIDPPGERLLRWLPSMQRRRERYQGILSDVVDRFGP
ncbi:MAG: hypothetical protein ABR549_13740, partial [Mycobacteriales bacterium]